MFRKTNIIIILSVFALTACDLDGMSQQEMLANEIGTLPAEKIVYAKATLTESPNQTFTGDCVIGKQLALQSDGGKLALLSKTVPMKGCENALIHPDERIYDIEALEYDDGRKTYTATSPLGVIWLYDDRQRDEAEHAWTAHIYDYESGLGRSLIQTLVADDIEDLNLAATGRSHYTFVVEFKQEMVERDVKRLCYPLKADHAFGGPLDPRHPQTYLMKIYTDFNPQHAMAQLKNYGEVANVMMVER